MGDAEQSELAGFSTRAIHAGQDPDPSTGAVVTPISLSTTFAQEGVGNHKGYEYSRSGNPTRTAVETQIAALEEARHGLSFASGLAAEDNILRLVPKGGRVLLGILVLSWGAHWLAVRAAGAIEHMARQRLQVADLGELLLESLLLFLQAPAIILYTMALGKQLTTPG